MADVAALVLVAAALTKRVRTGLLCGAIAAISQLLTLISFYSYSYTVAVAIETVPLQSLRVLTYAAAGLIGGYLGHRIAEARVLESSRHIRRTGR
jgi:sulfite exporter TauE/SafE